MRTKDSEKLNLIADYIKSYTADHNGIVPSLMDIMEYTKLPKATAYRYVRALNDTHGIKYSGKNTLTVDGEKYSSASIVKLPICGAVPCGSPDEWEQHVEGYVAVPQEWCKGECYLLRTYGDSMVDLGIEPNDIVLVQKTDTAEEGQVVVALTEEGNTLKRITYNDGRPILLAENRNYPQEKKRIVPNELKIQGIALKLIKDIR